VLDFGLAKVLESAPDNAASFEIVDTHDGSRVGIVLGTPSYMSPNTGGSEW